MVIDDKAEALKGDQTDDNVDPADSDDDDVGEATPEVEVVRAGTGGSQPDKQRGFRRRVNKLNARVDTANEGTAEAKAELATEREKNKLLELANAQLKANANPTVPPDPIDFDDGAKDPKYAQALRDFNQPLIAAEIDKRMSTLPAQQAQVASFNPEIERRRQQHYDRAHAMKAKDFEEVEDKAITILGVETVNHLIQNSDRSHIVLYYLGKNPDVAEDIKSLIDTDPLRATLQIGRLEAELSVQPKADLEPTPDPDTELQGGTSATPGQSVKFQKRLDKLREKAAERGGSHGSNSMGAILKLKREAEEAGVTVT